MRDSTESTKRPWRAPELRDLGSVTELTQAAPSGDGSDAGTYAS
jgi:hypothetical protein